MVFENLSYDYPMHMETEMDTSSLRLTQIDESFKNPISPNASPYGCVLRRDAKSTASVRKKLVDLLRHLRNCRLVESLSPYQHAASHFFDCPLYFSYFHHRSFTFEECFHSSSQSEGIETLRRSVPLIVLLRLFLWACGSRLFVSMCRIVVTLDGIGWGKNVTIVLVVSTML